MPPLSVVVNENYRNCFSSAVFNLHGLCAAYIYYPNYCVYFRRFGIFISFSNSVNKTIRNRRYTRKSFSKKYAIGMMNTIIIDIINLLIYKTCARNNGEVFLVYSYDDCNCEHFIGVITFGRYLQLICEYASIKDYIMHMYYSHHNCADLYFAFAGMKVTAAMSVRQLAIILYDMRRAKQ